MDFANAEHGIRSLQSSPPPPKRSVRTYGRPKDALHDEPATTPAIYLPPRHGLQYSSSDIDSDEVIPATPERPEGGRQTRLVVDDDETSVADNNASDFFGWKAKLREMDEKLDDVSTSMAAAAPISSPTDSSPKRVVPEIPVGTTSSSLMPHAAPPYATPISPMYSPFQQNRRKTRVRMNSDESGSDDIAAKSSPRRPRLNTSLPTSDNEVTSLPELTSQLQSASRRKRATPTPSEHYVEEKKHTSQATTRIKKPTKKEIAETKKESARIVSRQRVTIPKTVHASRKEYSLSSWASVHMPSQIHRESSDAIESFSSSPGQPRDNATQMQAPLSRPLSIPGVHDKDLDDDEGDEFPDVSTVVNASKIPKHELEPSEALLNARSRKQQYLEQHLPTPIDNDDDDGLIIVSALKVSPKRLPPAKIPIGRKIQLGLAGVPLVAARGPKHRGDKAKLNQDLLQKHNDKAEEEARQRRTEWENRGGKLKETDIGPANPDWQEVYVARAAEISQGDTMEVDPGSDADDLDQEWTAEADSGEEDGPGDTTLVEDGDIDFDHDSDSENQPVARRRRNTAIAILDDEDVSMDIDQSKENIYLSPNEEDGDKENDSSLLTDGEDKENFSVSRPPLGSRRASLMSPEQTTNSRLSMSPERDLMDDTEMNRGIGPRTPLKPLDDESKPPVLSFAARLRQRPDNELSSPGPLTPQIPSSAATLQPSPSLEPFSVLKKSASLEFSQFDGGFEKGFGDLFNEGTQDAESRKFGKILSRAESLNLTQDIGLQPAFQISENLKKRADAIFEKEQQYLLEEVVAPKARPKVEYVNEHGFLTQTRPEGDAEVYFVATPIPTQSTTIRQPPGGLIIEGELEVPESPEVFRYSHTDIDVSGTPRRRLRKRDESPSERTRERRVASPQVPHKPTKVKRRLKKSEYVQGEAVESDEEGFGSGSGDDEDEDDALDEIDSTLVDDKTMSERELGEAKVLEKHQEHMAEDDLKLEALVQKAVDGRLRKEKNRRGLDVDDSDDETDDETRQLRNRNSRKRTDRDEIKALEANPETKPFANVNDPEFFDDPNDPFSIKNQEQNQDESIDTLVDMSPGSSYKEGDAETSFTSVSNSKTSVRNHSQSTLRILDPNDTSFTEQGYDEGDQGLFVKITEVSPSNKRSAESSIDSYSKRLKTWANGTKSRSQAGTSRSTAGAAITGQPKRAKVGGGSLRGIPAPLSTTDSNPKRRKATTSFLKNVASDRKARFGDT